MKICAVGAPYYTASRNDALTDLAAQVGGRVLGLEPGIAIKDATLEDLGQAKKIIITAEKTTFVGGHTNEKELAARIADIEGRFTDTNSPFRQQLLKERLRRLVGGAALIRVGGITEPEARERKLRIEDALFATRAAIAEGIVPGGGVALVRAAATALAKSDPSWSVDEAAGANIIRRACDEPCRQIAGNSGGDPSVIIAQVRQAKGSRGYNAATGKFEDLLAAGVVDPTMVVRLALQNAASIAGLLLSSEALIADARNGPVDFPESGSGADALSMEPFLSRRDRRPQGGQG